MGYSCIEGNALPGGVVMCVKGQRRVIVVLQQSLLQVLEKAHFFATTTGEYKINANSTREKWKNFLTLVLVSGFYDNKYYRATFQNVSHDLSLLTPKFFNRHFFQPPKYLRKTKN